MSRLIPACQGHEEKSPAREGPGKKRREALREDGMEKRVPTPRRLACAGEDGMCLAVVAGRQGIEWFFIRHANSLGHRAKKRRGLSCGFIKFVLAADVGIKPLPCNRTSCGARPSPRQGEGLRIEFPPGSLARSLGKTQQAPDAGRWPTGKQMRVMPRSLWPALPGHPSACMRP